MLTPKFPAAIGRTRFQLTFNNQICNRRFTGLLRSAAILYCTSSCAVIYWWKRKSTRRQPRRVSHRANNAWSRSVFFAGMCNCCKITTIQCKMLQFSLPLFFSFFCCSSIRRTVYLCSIAASGLPRAEKAAEMAKIKMKSAPSRQRLEKLRQNNGNSVRSGYK